MKAQARATYYIFTSLLVMILCAGGGVGCYAVEYRMDMLEAITKEIGVQVFDNDSIYHIKYGARGVLARVRAGVVEHIGYEIFSADIRKSQIDGSVADFVERYWLSLTLPIKRQRTVSQQLKEDRFVFVKGSVESIDDIQRRQATDFSCNATEKSVDMIWSSGDETLCHISFPVNHELILGRKMLENDRRLPAEIMATRVEYSSTDALMRSSLTEMRDSIVSMWVSKGGSYYLEELTADRYYTNLSSGPIKPVFSASFPRESLINLFSGLDVSKADKIGLRINHVMFGFSKQLIETTVPQFVAYCMSNGCKPYVGIVSLDCDGKGTADVLVIMRNWRIGYNHVLRLKIPVESISTGTGIAEARLNAFVPTANVENLYKNP